MSIGSVPDLPSEICQSWLQHGEGRLTRPVVKGMMITADGWVYYRML